MTRRVMFAVLVLLLSSLVGESACAQQKALEKDNFPFKNLWTKADGVDVLRLYDTTGPKWPQIVVMRLSEETYELYAKDRKAFINGRHIFPVPVNRVIHVHVYPVSYSASAKPGTKPVKDDWYVTLEHMPDSDASSSETQILP